MSKRLLPISLAVIVLSTPHWQPVVADEWFYKCIQTDAGAITYGSEPCNVEYDQEILIVETDTPKLPPLYQWESTDIGFHSKQGSIKLTPSNQYIVTAHSGDIFRGNDDFYFVYQSLPSESSNRKIEIIACIDSFTANHPWAKAGVMIRDSISADAINMAIEVSNKQGIALQWREKNGGKTKWKGTRGKAGDCVKLVLQNNRIAGHYKPSSRTSWEKLSEQSLNLQQGHMLLGLIVSSHDMAKAQASFSRVELNEIKPNEIVSFNLTDNVSNNLPAIQTSHFSDYRLYGGYIGEGTLITQDHSQYLFWSSPTGHLSKLNFILYWRHIFVRRMQSF